MPFYFSVLPSVLFNSFESTTNTNEYARTSNLTCVSFLTCKRFEKCFQYTYSAAYFVNYIRNILISIHIIYYISLQYSLFPPKVLISIIMICPKSSVHQDIVFSHNFETVRLCVFFSISRQNAHKALIHNYNCKILQNNGGELELLSLSCHQMCDLRQRLEHSKFQSPTWLLWKPNFFKYKIHLKVY